jgi:uncharacterized protein
MILPREKSFVTRRLSALLLLFCSSAGVAGINAPDRKVATPIAPRVPDKIERGAQPFPPQAVRLLDGPFKEAMARDQAYLLSLDPDRLLHNFRVNAGLPSSAQPLGGWEAPDVELRGHSVGHYLSALALMYAGTDDERFKSRAELIVAELAKVQQALTQKGAGIGYLSAFPEEFIDRVEAPKPVWAPYYTLHKIMAGLLDVYVQCGTPQALDVLQRQADWVKRRVDALSFDQQQAMLGTEFGGMNDVFANLYATTGNAEYLRLAQTFDHRAVFDSLANRRDALDGLHANTQIPKVIGAAREFELTGQPRYRTIATTFWTRVAKYRSYANGGHSDEEGFFPVDQFPVHLGAESSETCNTYNMLKLTRHLFGWIPSADLMDFYERGLYNHILASQDSATGGVIYYCPLKPGAFKTFSTPNDAFWCCVGTGMENPARYTDAIYFAGDQSLFVNLFIPSELTWRDQGLVLRQETRFPEQDSIRLTLTLKQPVRLSLRVRYPSWARDGMTVAINGKGEAYDGTPGSFATLVRHWQNGDVIDIRLPMRLRTEPLPGDPRTVALFYGPVLLAGDLGSEGLSAKTRYGTTAPELSKLPPVTIPGLVFADGDPISRIRAVDGRPLTFRTEGLAQPHDVTLLPFFRVTDTRYTVYWRMFSPVEWTAHSAALEAAAARRGDVERRTVDVVNTDSADSERQHSGEGLVDERRPWFEGRSGRESKAAPFSYQLTLPSAGAAAVVVTYRGASNQSRVFDLLVDGQVVARETLPLKPTELVDIERPVPAALTKGKSSIRIGFRPAPDATTGAVFEVRTVKRQQ